MSYLTRITTAGLLMAKRGGIAALGVASLVEFQSCRLPVHPPLLWFRLMPDAS